MKTQAPPGRRVETVPLPGDGPVILDQMIRLAIRRDNRFNWQEQAVYMCVAQQNAYGVRAYCMMEYCSNCGGWSVWTTGQLSGTTLPTW